MAGTITKDNLFRAARPNPHGRTDVTTSAVRSIVRAEADSREAKTQRLRQARLEMEAQQAVPAPVVAGAAKKAKKAASPRAA